MSTNHTILEVQLSAIATIKMAVWARAQIRELLAGHGFGFETDADEQRDEEIAMFEDMLVAIDKAWENM